MHYSLALYWDTRDVTRWVDSLVWRQAKGSTFQELQVTFRGWFPTSLVGRWDLYGSYAAGTPRSELLFRGGVIPPDRPGVVDVARGTVVPDSVQIVDWAWIAQRTTPRTTLVIAPDRSAAARAAARADSPIGYWSFVPAATMHAAVRKLAALGRFRVQVLVPDYPMTATVIEPTRSLFDAIRGLVDGTDIDGGRAVAKSADYFFRRDRLTLVIGDKTTTHLRVGRTLNLSADAIAGLQLSPSPFRHVNRLLIKVPAA